VQRLLYQFPDTEFCMCAGDDKTDEDMFHSMARVVGSAVPGHGAIVAPPESLLLFPSLAKTLAATAGPNGAIRLNGDGEVDTLEPKESKLDPAAMYMIAIEAKDTQSARMTMANCVLNGAEEMVALLAQLAEVN